MVSKIRISACRWTSALMLGLCLCLSIPAQAQYQSLCWRISGNGLKHPSYLYGTMHISDSRVFHFSDATQQAFADAPIYAMELDPAKAFSMGLIAKLMMPAGKTIKQMVPDSDYRFIDSMIRGQTMGMGMKLLDHFEPVIVSTLLAQSGMQADSTAPVPTPASAPASAPTHEHTFMDMDFYNRARRQKKKIIGIETADEQIEALHSLSYEEQAVLLVQTVQSLKKAKGENDEQKMLQYYVDQNLDSLLVMDDVHQMPPKFYKALVTDRNVVMSDRISGFIKHKTTFIAVGALHLPGAEGVISLLRRRGYTVEEYK